MTKPTQADIDQELIVMSTLRLKLIVMAAKLNEPMIQCMSAAISTLDQRLTTDEIYAQPGWSLAQQAAAQVVRFWLDGDNDPSLAPHIEWAELVTNSIKEVAI
jgi:hypothetical protein